MSRSFYTPAVVLSVRRFGEDNREAVLLTPERGIVRATVFGGAKSKLRSLVAPYHGGTIWLYHDPVRNTTKVTDFDVTAFRAEIRENLTRTWAAAAGAELVIKTLAGGTDFSTVFTFVNGFFEGICRTNDEGTRYGLLRFFWRYLDFMGERPTISCCARCETPVHFAGEKSENAVVWYAYIDNAFVCSDCINQSEPHDAVTAEMLAFLDCIDHGTMAESRAMRLSPNGYNSLRHIMFTLIAKTCGSPLGSITTAGGII